MTTIISDTTGIPMMIAATRDGKIVEMVKSVPYGFTNIAGLQIGDIINVVGVDPNSKRRVIGIRIIDKINSTDILAKFEIYRDIQTAKEIAHLAKNGIFGIPVETKEKYSELTDLEKLRVKGWLQVPVEKVKESITYLKIRNVIQNDTDLPHIAGIADKTAPSTKELGLVTGVVVIFFIIFLGIIGYLLYNRTTNPRITSSAEIPETSIDIRI